MIAHECSRRWGGRVSVVLGVLLGFAALPQISAAAAPAHAHTSEFGSGWECDRGYMQQDNSCARVAVPAHAYLDDSGDDWVCERGYHRARGGCDAIKLPVHAHLSGFSDLRGWDCDRGYRADGGSCRAIQVPMHAYLVASGDDWACRRGYVKQGNTACTPVAVPAPGHPPDRGTPGSATWASVRTRRAVLPWWCLGTPLRLTSSTTPVGPAIADTAHRA